MKLKNFWSVQKFMKFGIEIDESFIWVMAIIFITVLPARDRKISKQKYLFSQFSRILGIVFLIFGFITLLGSLIYCVVLCRENPYPRYPDDFYWTHHWSKTIGPSEIHYSASEKPYRQNGHSDRYNKYNGKYSDRESAKGYSDIESKLSRYWLCRLLYSDLYLERNVLFFKLLAFRPALFRAFF